MSPDSPPIAPSVHQDGGRDRHSRLLSMVAAVVALVVLGGAALLWLGFPGDDAAGQPDPAPTASDEPGPTGAAAPTREEAVEALLSGRAAAVTGRDRTGFLAHVDPTQVEFAQDQTRLFDRLLEVPLTEWTYEVTGEGPALTTERAAQLPERSAIVQVRLSYRLDGTTTVTDREQFLTVVPRGGRWLLAGDSDASASGFDTQRDLWDLGPVRVVRGDESLVVADRRGAGRGEVRRLADVADQAVADVDRVWRSEWSRRPVVVLPRSQEDMATVIGSDGKGLAQIAAVTTGSFEEGLSRGDRIVVNPEAFGTLGSLGRRVVLSHEMTHVATRATTVQPVPVWLSEGFADYVAYDATPVPTSIVASDVLDQVRDGDGPRQLPDAADFDAGEGDVAAAYEGAWLAARMIAEQDGEKRLVRFYEAMGDSAGPGWPEETTDVLGVSAQRLTRQWRDYLADLAAS
ncbi:MAG: hypothetical protein ACRDWY_14520 [Actinomycetes bacterium]